MRLGITARPRQLGGTETTRKGLDGGNEGQAHKDLQSRTVIRKRCRQFCRTLASKTVDCDIERLRTEIDDAIEERWTYAGENPSANEILDNANLLSEGAKLVIMKKKYEQMWRQQKQIHGREWYVEKRPDIIAALRSKKQLYQRWEKIRQRDGDRAQEAYYLRKKLNKENCRVRRELRKIRSELWTATSERIQDFMEAGGKKDYFREVKRTYGWTTKTTIHCSGWVNGQLRLRKLDEALTNTDEKELPLKESA